MRRLLAVVLALAACGAPADDVVAPSPGGTDRPVAASGSEASTDTAEGVPAALDWTVEKIDGGQIDGGDLVGGDVVLWFWAPW